MLCVARCATHISLSLCGRARDRQKKAFYSFTSKPCECLECCCCAAVLCVVSLSLFGYPSLLQLLALLFFALCSCRLFPCRAAGEIALCSVRHGSWPMPDFCTHRGVTAPRTAGEVSAPVHANGGGDDLGKTKSSWRSRSGPCRCCCWCNRRDSSRRSRSSSRRTSASSIKVGEKHPRGCGCWCFSSRRMFSLCTRQRTRQSGAFVLLFLAAAFSLRGWRAAMMINSRRWSTTSADEFYQQQQLWRKDEERGSGQCEWKPNGPIMFNLQHSKLHADGEKRWLKGSVNHRHTAEHGLHRKSLQINLYCCCCRPGTWYCCIRQRFASAHVSVSVLPRRETEVAWGRRASN